METAAREARRIPGALNFLNELEQFAAECARVGAIIDDELALRRRRRSEALRDDLRSEETQVKAL